MENQVMMKGCNQGQDRWRIHVRIISILAAMIHTVQLSTQLFHVICRLPFYRTGSKLAASHIH